jgi:hypothetical protein
MPIANYRLVGRLRHSRWYAEGRLACLLRGVDRKWVADRQNDAIDPLQASASM